MFNKKYTFKVKYFGTDKENNIYFSFKEKPLDGFLLTEENKILKEFLKKEKIFIVKLQLDKNNNEIFILKKNTIFIVKFCFFKVLKFGK